MPRDELLSVEARWLPTLSLESPSTLDGFHGLWIVPGSSYKSLLGALSAIRYAHEQPIPLLGTCGGFQHIVIEYARHVLGLSDAAHAKRLIAFHFAPDMFSGRTQLAYSAAAR